MFKKSNGIKRGKLIMNKHEAMQITDCMCKNNNFFVKNI